MPLHAPCWYDLCGFCSVSRCQFMHDEYAALLRTDLCHVDDSPPSHLPSCSTHASHFLASYTFRWYEYRTAAAGKCQSCRWGLPKPPAPSERPRQRYCRLTYSDSDSEGFWTGGNHYSGRNNDCSQSERSDSEEEDDDEEEEDIAGGCPLKQEEEEAAEEVEGEEEEEQAGEVDMEEEEEEEEEDAQAVTSAAAPTQPLTRTEHPAAEGSRLQREHEASRLLAQRSAGPRARGEEVMAEQDAGEDADATAAWTCILPVPLHSTAFRAFRSPHFLQLMKAAMGEPETGRDVVVLMDEEAALSRRQSRQYGHVVLLGTAAQVQQGRRALGLVMDEGFQHSPLYGALSRVAAALHIPGWTPAVAATLVVQPAEDQQGESDMDEDDSGWEQEEEEEEMEDDEELRRHGAGPVSNPLMLIAAPAPPPVARSRWREGGGRYKLK